MPKFWRVPLPGEQSNPGSRQGIYRFPDSRTVFWSNPGSWEYLSRPCGMFKFSVKSLTRGWVLSVGNNLWIRACVLKFEQGIFSNKGFVGLQKDNRSNFMILKRRSMFRCRAWFLLKYYAFVTYAFVNKGKQRSKIPYRKKKTIGLYNPFSQTVFNCRFHGSAS